VLALGLLVMLPLGAADRVEVEATEALREARRLTEGTAERDLITTSITRRLLGVPTAPKGWEVGYRQEVAYAALPGDTCQLLTRDDGRCLLAVVDVAGHGTEPALQALRLRTETAALWRAGSTVEQLASAINSSMVEVTTIATGVLVDLDIATGDCRYVNAGHPPVVVARAGSIEDWQPTGPLFGLPAATFSVTEAHLDRSCFLVVYTDGVTEARSLDRSFLGESAIHRSLRHHLATGAQAIADGCVDAALAHSSSRLRDDALVVVLTRH
jgi:serine phosphatase RsbU (regulator of sigma subunit)